MAVSTISIRNFRAGHPRSDYDAEDGVTKRRRQTLRPTETWILSKPPRIFTPAMTTELPTADQELHMQTATERGFGTRETCSGTATGDVQPKVLRHAKRCSGTATGDVQPKVLRHAKRCSGTATGDVQPKVLRHAKWCSGTATGDV